MKKTVLMTALMAVFTLTACEDKQAIQQATQQASEAVNNLVQLKKDYQQLESAMVAKDQEIIRLNKLLEEAQTSQSAGDVVGLQVKIKELYKAKEQYLLPKEGDVEEGEGTVQIVARVAETNQAWLNDLLMREMLVEAVDEETMKAFDQSAQKVDEATLQTHYEEMFEEYQKEAIENRLIGMHNVMRMGYMGQRNHLAQFSIWNESYNGGAHGVHHTNYIVVDLAKKQRITLNDVFSSSVMDELNLLLQGQYLVVRSNYELEESLDMKDFRVSDNFYFSPTGITFVYPLYELGPYVLGEVELSLNYQQMNHLLNKPFQQTEADGFFKDDDF